MSDDVHIRGTGIIGPIKGLRIHRQQALDLLPEPLHHYLSGEIRIDAWYPFADHLELLRTLIAAAPVTAADPWRWMGEETADFDLVEVYPSMVQRGSPRGTLLRLPEAWRLYHDTGDLRVELANDRAGRIELTDFPFTTDEYCRLLTGYFGEALRLSGTEEATVVCASHGDDRAVWDVSW